MLVFFIYKPKKNPIILFYIKSIFSIRFSTDINILTKLKFLIIFSKCYFWHFTFKSMFCIFKKYIGKTRVFKIWKIEIYQVIDSFIFQVYVYFCTNSHLSWILTTVLISRTDVRVQITEVLKSINVSSVLLWNM